MAEAILTISSKNYSSWSLRGWLLVKFSGLPFTEELVTPDDPEVRAELLLWLSSVLGRINDPPASLLDQLLPWNWKAGPQAAAA